MDLILIAKFVMQVGGVSHQHLKMSEFPGPCCSFTEWTGIFCSQILISIFDILFRMDVLHWLWTELNLQAQSPMFAWQHCSIQTAHLSLPSNPHLFSFNYQSLIFSFQSDPPHFRSSSLGSLSGSYSTGPSLSSPAAALGIDTLAGLQPIIPVNGRRKRQTFSFGFPR